MPVATRPGPLRLVASAPPTLEFPGRVVEREPLAGAGDGLLDGGERSARLGLHDEVAGGVVDDGVHAAEVQHEVDAAPAAAPRHLGAAATGHDREPVRQPRHAAPRPPRRSRPAGPPAPGDTPSTASAGPASATSPQAEPSAVRAASRSIVGALIRTAPPGRPRPAGARPVPAGHLAAQPRGREDLAGVGDVVGVEGAADQLHRVQVVVGEHPRHVGGLVDADAVLAGDRAAGGDAEVEDRAADLLGRLAGALDRVVEQHEGVQVAVAGVEHVGDPDAGGRRRARRSRASTSGSAVRGMTPSWTM